jgi:hypothetical protein
MSLAKASGVNVPHNVETDLVSFTGDGIKKLLGFNAEGTVDALFTLKIGGAFEAAVRTSAENLTAVFYDRLITTSNGVVYKVTVLQTSGTAQTFSGTILGS